MPPWFTVCAQLDQEKRKKRYPTNTEKHAQKIQIAHTTTREKKKKKKKKELEHHGDNRHRWDIDRLENQASDPRKEKKAQLEKGKGEEWGGQII